MGFREKEKILVETIDGSHNFSYDALPTYNFAVASSEKDTFAFVFL